MKCRDAGNGYTLNFILSRAADDESALGDRVGIVVIMVLVGNSNHIRLEPRRRQTDILAEGISNNHKEGRRVIIWGVLILFVMLSFWGLVTVVCTSLFGQCPPPAL